MGEEDLPHIGDVHQGLGENGVVEDALHPGADGEEAGGVRVADGLPEVVAEAGAEHGQGQARDVLVGPEGDGQHGEDQGPQPRHQDGADQGDEEGDPGAGPSGLLIEVHPGDPGDAPHEHHALHAQVQVAGFLRQQLSQQAEEQGSGGQDAGGEEVDEVAHAVSSFPSVSLWRKTSR